MDRALVNAQCMNSKVFHGEILHPGISDYSPMIFNLNEENHIRAPFRDFNYWAKMPGSSKIIQELKRVQAKNI